MVSSAVINVKVGTSIITLEEQRRGIASPRTSRDMSQT